MAYELVELTMEFRLSYSYHDCPTNIYYRTNLWMDPVTFTFDFNILRNESQLGQTLHPFFYHLRLDTDTDAYRRLIRDISEGGLRLSQRAFNLGCNSRVLPLISQVQARLVEHRVDLPYSDDNEYMVPAAESSVDEMLIKVRVEDEAEEKDCVICLEQLKVGSDASSMPCKHIFHGDCIQEWLSTSHYCPICRFEMPTH
ncbi:probable E3 ubiquitin-protein ligase RHC2A [Hibiscus syriacus]|uniref:probable E3 ubiquitin-protein ligase RHC2A n=1 Tax=Hibiscus syriacus TaxID=106335 RepID=UPI001920E63B|nr:probable E3 ubiquitin-protein ligase RHC2A [Hibiscus syriacus]